MKNYYYVNDTGEVTGPVSSEELKLMHFSGKITSTTQVCEEGSEDWKYYGAVATEAKAAPVQASIAKTAPVQALSSNTEAQDGGRSPWRGPPVQALSSKNTEERLASYLQLIRDHSSYSILRVVTKVSLFLAVMALVITALIALNYYDWRLAGIAITLIPVVFATYQSAILFIDMADSFLHEHSKNKN